MRIAPLLVIAPALAISTRAWAHKPSDAHVDLAIDGDHIAGRIDIAIRDLDAAIGLDDNDDGEITWGELVAAAPRVDAYVLARLALPPCTVHLARAGLVDLSDGPYWSLPFSADCPHKTRSLELAYALLFDVDAQHRGLVHVSTSTSQTLIVRDARPVRVDLGAGTSLREFVVEGIWHIWHGLDHLLFLFALLLPVAAAPRGRTLRSVAVEVFAIVPAFTLAHSITLVISASGLATLPTRFVETAIALSVVAAAANNLAHVMDARWAVAFALGLLHGFGFSSVLVDLGLPSRDLVVALLGFNVGVEIGQAVFVLAVLPVLFATRRSVFARCLLYGGSGAIAAVAAVWAYERCFS